MDKLVFIYNQLFVRLPYPDTSYAGKTVVVTGSNVGLGKEAARHFARLGASKLILAVRSLEKGRAAKEDIEATTGCAKDAIEVWQLDMSSYANVQDFAARLEGLPRVDVFVANAGIVSTKYQTIEGNEATITVNVVSTFLLMALVMPKLRETASRYNIRPTFTVTSSEMHAWSPFRERDAPEGGIFDAVNESGKKDPGGMYPLSKLLEVLSVRAIAETYPAEKLPVAINTVNPGFCHSELARDVDSWGMWLMKKLLARETEYGSRNLVAAASMGAESHGKYVSNCVVEEPSDFVRSEEGKKAQGRVWAELEKKLEAIKPGVMSKF